MLNSHTTGPRRFAIIADDESGKSTRLFTWYSTSSSRGVERAKREAKEFGRSDLHNFRAEPAR